ncbi:hypothetical protein OCF08_21150 [Bacillus cereus]|nr:hypothetical protein [Bacillus cereus]
MVTQENYKEVYGDIEIKEIDRDCYVTLKKYERILHICKLGLLIGFILLFFFCFSYREIRVGLDSFEDVFRREIILLFVGILFIRIAFSYGLRWLIHHMVKRVYKERIEGKQVKKQRASYTILGGIKAGIILILSPDLSAAKYYKNRFREFVEKNKDKLHGNDSFGAGETENECSKNYIDKYNLCIQCNDSLKFMTKFYVKFSNWYNLAISMFLAGVILCIGISADDSYPNYIIYTLFILLLLRLLSRTIEIAKAFYDDVVQVGVRIYNKDAKKVYLHDWKNSYIRKPLRISLAIHSLLELILMFTCAYILTFFMFGSHIGFQDKVNNQSPDYKLTKEIKNDDGSTSVYIQKTADSSKVTDYIVEGKVYEFFAYAVSICFFNISYINYGVPWWNILHVWQVTMSMVLIILCIACYLGKSDDMYPRESEFFSQTLKKIDEQNFGKTF